MIPGAECPLCGALAPFATRAAPRPVHRCPECDLRFVPAAHHLSPEQERARYRLHRNSIEDAGYVRFLSPVVEALKRRLPCRATPPLTRQGLPAAGAPAVLDYGCGPDPVLVKLLRRAGYDAAGYDPFFHPDTELRRGYDAVVSTETFEHFRAPATEIERVVRLLKPGGVLAVMTALYDGQDLATWHYSLDATHVCFYTIATFRFVAVRWGLQVVETNDRNLIVMVNG